MIPLPKQSHDLDERVALIRFELKLRKRKSALVAEVERSIITWL